MVTTHPQIWAFCVLIVKPIMNVHTHLVADWVDLCLWYSIWFCNSTNKY